MFDTETTDGWHRLEFTQLVDVRFPRPWRWFLRPVTKQVTISFMVKGFGETAKICGARVEDPPLTLPL
jgi:hypothetical protein